MSSVESAATVQPVIKDVQTLKANLKEQEKRARSENEVEEVAPVSVTDQQTPVQDDAGEQRKRRKVSNPTGPTKESQEPLLDGPLPATSTESVEPSNGTTHSINGAAKTEKDAPSAAPVAASPCAKATEPAQSLAPKTTAPEAKASAPSEENKSQAKAATVPAPTEVANEPAASNDESKTETANHEKSDAKAAHPEAGKAEPAVSTEIKDKAPQTAAKPAEAVAITASS
ncbi:uncharacterized protein PGTG_01805 [Puccinia graminis f. sp. tritici CRL 75-36-700-3]|uniref:Uncharacterized protein n=1 Tax=Puccinia graminis f. sp. tritici (strain CRL 75-36-700-3 / race SCCL) TaxID=418459 RepID=E3JTD8_PUCGT|nr:uncharacterized protein PGTG_01805 [Puccinia graminis f. sp. tritici CRL 75-36-700-3]EFP75212.1 hypothetical protein PGTG_01805 [Puccinia graminis f. sp. tritici CRL 75-36-700-3]